MEEEVRQILSEQSSPSRQGQGAEPAGNVNAAAKRLQALFAKARQDYSVEQFLDEKHAEAQRELAEDGKEFGG